MSENAIDNRPATDEVPVEKQPRQFVSFSFYKLDPVFRRDFDDGARTAAVDEFAKVIENARSRYLIYPYSTLGIRAETDFLLWQISYRIEDFADTAASILRTTLGRYLTTPHSFLSMTKTSIYVDDHVHEDQEGTRNKIVISGRKYLFVYPFVKTRQWYVLPKEERMRIMRQHILLGHEFPSVKLNTTYSFGLDDQDFVVAFESNHCEDFVDLVQQLRETESSLFTQRDTPIITCMSQDLRVTLAQVAGVAAGQPTN